MTTNGVSNMSHLNVNDKIMTDDSFQVNPDQNSDQAQSSTSEAQVTYLSQSSVQGGIYRWDHKNNKVVQIQRPPSRSGSAVKRDSNSNLVVPIQHKTPTPETSDSSSVSSHKSTKSEPALSYRWSVQDKRVVLNDIPVSRWDYKTNQAIRVQMGSRGSHGSSAYNNNNNDTKKPSSKVNSLPFESTEPVSHSVATDGLNKVDSSSSLSPTSVLFDINENTDYDKEPLLLLATNSIRSKSAHRPYSADVITRKKRIKELQVKQMLNKLSKSDSSLERNEAAMLHQSKVTRTESGQFMSLDLNQQISSVTKLNETLNENIIRKDSLIEEQQRVIDDLMNQVEILSRQSERNKIPAEVKLGKETKEGDQGDEKDNHDPNLLSQFFSPFFSNSTPSSNVSSISAITDGI